jgi:ATP-dependent DNA ligase
MAEGHDCRRLETGSRKLAMYIGFARRWPRLRSRSYIIDTEAVACDRSFDLVHRHRVNDRVFLYAFDLIELNGDDLRHDPLEGRTATLGLILAKAWPAFSSNSQMSS